MKAFIEDIAKVKKSKILHFYIGQMLKNVELLDVSLKKRGFVFFHQLFEKTPK